MEISQGGIFVEQTVKQPSNRYVFNSSIDAVSSEWPFDYLTSWNECANLDTAHPEKQVTRGFKEHSI